MFLSIIQNTALHYACGGGHLEAVQLLLDKRADVTVKNTHNAAPLDLAIDNMHSEVAIAMLKSRRQNLILKGWKYYSSPIIKWLNRCDNKNKNSNKLDPNGAPFFFFTLYINAQEGCPLECSYVDPRVLFFLPKQIRRWIVFFYIYNHILFDYSVGASVCQLEIPKV